MCEGVEESLIFLQEKLNKVSKAYADLYCEVTDLKVRVAELERKNTDLELSLDEPWRDNIHE